MLGSIVELQVEIEIIHAMPRSCEAIAACGFLHLAGIARRSAPEQTVVFIGTELHVARWCEVAIRIRQPALRSVISFPRPGGNCVQADKRPGILCRVDW